ncbi:glycosyl transferase family 2 [Rhodanobacter sp. Root627]|uniref:glycosyltransferase family 2 protein n=1 Tax=Rhodanobacter sp. Root627 TaxID=1736572 RepID=UPI0006FFAD41|nr:glycosyltransferase family A protein [Rhodanobacter sp. Root627]KRA33129.1 glycosyl transferase family 2 [Rhodanobacter sp. Root627]
MSFFPLVSVIIPVRNCRDYIHEAIDSVLGQDYSNLEIIVIDDGSDDYEYSELQKMDGRIAVRRLSGMGVSHARNVAMAMAKGSYFAFLDADDIWFPGKLTAQVNYCEKNPHAGCVFGGFAKWERDASDQFPPSSLLTTDCHALTGADPARSGWMYTRLLMGQLVGMNTALIRREVFEKLGGFDESMRVGEDYLFWLKVSRVFEMHALAGTVALYRIHESSAMGHLDEPNHLALMLKAAVSRWGLSNPDGTKLDQDEFEARLAATEFAHGYKHFWHGSATAARRSLLVALRSGFRPGRSLAYIVLLPFRRWLSVLRSRLR